MDQSEYVENLGVAVSKVDMYGWTVANSPGQFQWIDKRLLKINKEYQRDAIESKVLSFARDWNWQACGVLHVSFREGAYWVFDGGHRLMAAMKRSDISSLPCMIFDCGKVSEEARGFLAVNSHRRAVTALEKHSARTVSGDHLAWAVNAQIAACGLVLTKSANSAGQIKCLDACMRMASQSMVRFNRVLSLAAEICTADGLPVGKYILFGLWYVDGGCTEETGEKVDLTHARLADRIRKLGAQRLCDAIARAGAFAGNRDQKVSGRAIVDEVNKGLRSKFNL